MPVVELQASAVMMIWLKIKCIAVFQLAAAGTVFVDLDLNYKSATGIAAAYVCLF